MRHTFHFGLIWKIGDLIQPICRRITKLSGYFENITFHQDYLYSNKTKALICMARHTLNILRVACKETLSSSQQIGISALHRNEIQKPLDLNTIAKIEDYVAVSQIFFLKQI